MGAQDFSLEIYPPTPKATVVVAADCRDLLTLKYFRGCRQRFKFPLPIARTPVSRTGKKHWASIVDYCGEERAFIRKPFL